MEAQYFTRPGDAKNSGDGHAVDMSTSSSDTDMIDWTTMSRQTLKAMVLGVINTLKDENLGVTGNTGDAADCALSNTDTHAEVHKEDASQMGEHDKMRDNKKLVIPDSPTSVAEFQEQILIDKGVTLFLPETVANPASAHENFQTEEYSTQAAPMAHSTDAAFYRDVPKKDSTSPSGDVRSGERGVRELTSFLQTMLQCIVVNLNAKQQSKLSEIAECGNVMLPLSLQRVDTRLEDDTILV